jgi:hypothetical protein
MTHIKHTIATKPDANSDDETTVDVMAESLLNRLLNVRGPRPLDVVATFGGSLHVTTGSTEVLQTGSDQPSSGKGRENDDRLA